MTNKKTEQKILMVCNWKMHPGRGDEARKISTEIQRGSSKLKHIEVVVCPTAIHFPLVAKPKSGGNYHLGAQNSAWTENESLTGEISPAQIEDSGAEYCIVGHSERRMYGETNLLVAQKIQALLKQRIIPILCVGETNRDEKGEYLKVISAQLKDSLQGIQKGSIEKIVIAYEPLWAVGNGKKSASGSDIEEVLILIRRTLTDLYGFQKIPRTRILYGGSVTNKREVEEIIQRGHVDGCLIGRASLSAKTLIPLLEEAHRLKD